jgi:hypothetical protein
MPIQATGLTNILAPLKYRITVKAIPAPAFIRPNKRPVLFLEDEDSKVMVLLV